MSVRILSIAVALFFPMAASQVSAQTRSGLLDHFEWSAVSSPQQAGVPFEVSLSARDARGDILSGWSGPVLLSGRTAPMVPALVISELDMGNDRIEFTNPSTFPTDASGWKLDAYASFRWPQPTASFILPPGTIVSAGGVLQVAPFGITQVRSPMIFGLQGFHWALSLQTDPIAALLRDASGNFIDFVCAGTVDLKRIAEADVSRVWQGAPIAVNGAISYQRIGSINHFNSVDWVNANPSMGKLNPNLRVPFIPDGRRLAIEPATVPLQNGVWRGSVTVLEPGANVYLRADDGDGQSSPSSAFEVRSAPALVLEAPAAVFEASAGSFSGTIRIPTALSSNLLINLVSSAPSEIAVPSTVTISAGQTSASFSVTNLDDAIVDGSQRAEITARAAGYSSVMISILNHDSETAALALTVPATAGELLTLLRGKGTLSVNPPAGLDLTVNLTSSDPLSVRVVDSIVIPAGQSSAPFDLLTEDNTRIDGSRTVRITAAVVNWPSTSGSIVISDNEHSNLVLQVESLLREGSGVLTNKAVLSISGTLTTNLIIELHSSNPSKLAVPAQIVIPSGQTSASVPLTLPNDAQRDGAQSVRLEATSNGFAAARADVSVLDDDIDHFTFVPLPAAQLAGKPFPVEVQARSIDDRAIPNFSDQLTFGAHGLEGDITPQFAGAITNGVWSGVVTIASELRSARLLVSDRSNHSGASNPFDVTQVRIVRLPVSDLVYHAGTGQLLAGVPSGGGTNAPGITSLDPATGALGWSVPLGSEPGEMALSDDGTFLYSTLMSTGGVARIDLRTRVIDLRYALGESHPRYGAPIAEHLAVLPGNPDALAVSLRRGPEVLGEFIFDRGIARTNYAPPSSYTSTYTLEFGPSPSTLYAIFPVGFRKLAVDAMGIRVIYDVEGFGQSPHPTFVGGFGGGIVFEEELLYRTTGHVIDPGPVELAGTFPGSGLVIPDARVGRVFCLSSNASDMTISAFDQNTFRAAGSLAIPGIKGTPASFVRWGTNGFAFRTSDNSIVLVETDLIPQPAAIDLAISQTAASPVATVGADFTYSLTVSNLGPANATNVIVTDRLARDTVLQSVLTSQGSWSFTNRVVTLEIGALAAGASATISVVVQPKTPGMLVNRARVLGGLLNPGNDVSQQTNSAVFGATLPAVTRLELNAAALGYDAASNKLYAATPYDGQIESSVRPINLTDGLLESPMLLGLDGVIDATQLAVASGGRYVYAAVRNRNYQFPTAVYRLDFQTRNIDQRILNGTPVPVVAIKPVPGQPNSIAIAKQDDVEIYENGVPSKRIANVPCLYIEFNDTGARFYGVVSGPSPPLFEMSVGASGITLLSTTSGLLSGFDADIRFASGFLYSNTGEILDTQSLTRVARLPATGWVAPDASVNRVFFLTKRNSQWVLAAFDQTTLRPLWSFALPEIAGDPSNLVRCRPGILAFRTSMNQLFILNTALMPGAPVADLSIELSSSSGAVAIGETTTFTARIVNHGPDIARQVIVTNALPSGTELVAANSSQGVSTTRDGQIRCELGDLPPGGSATLTLLLRPIQAGTLRNTAGVTLGGQDPDPSNDTASAFTYVPESRADGVRTIEFSTSDLAYDPFSKKLYASTPDGPTTEANSLVVIDPSTGAAGAPIRVGSDPGKLTLSDDGQFLYVALNRESAVRRFHLKAQISDLRFSIGNGQVVEDMFVIPGRATSVVVTRFIGIAVYDDGIKRPREITGPFGSNSIEPSADPDRFFGFHNASSEFGFRTYSINATGISETSATRGLIFGYGESFKSSSGLVYSTTGGIIDPVALKVVGRFSGPGLADFDGVGAGSLVEPDIEHGRVYYLVSDGVWKLKAYDAVTLAPVGSLSLPSVRGKPSSLIRWGDDGLAFRTSGGQLFLCSRSQIRSANLSISQSLTPAAPVDGSTITYTVSVTNRGPATAHEVMVEDLLPANAFFVSAMASRGEVSELGGKMITRLGALTNGESATIQITSKASAPGMVLNEIKVLTDGLDLDPTDNANTLATTIKGVESPGLISSLSLPVTDIAYDSTRDQILASIGVETGFIVPVTPDTLVFGAPLPLGPSIYKLAISDNGQFLYAAMSTGGVARVDLRIGKVELRFSLGADDRGSPLFVGDMAVMPGRPETLAVSSSRSGIGGPNAWTLIYDNGVPRTNAIPPSGSGGVYPIQFAEPSLLYSTYRNTFRIIKVDDSGATLVSEIPGLVPGIETAFVADQGLAYFNAGRIVDPKRGLIVGNLPFSGLMIPDAAHQRLYLLRSELTSLGRVGVVRALASDTFNELWSVRVPNVSGSILNFISCGNGRLAFPTSGNQLYILRTGLIPDRPTADLALSQTLSNPNPAAGSKLSANFSIQNLGPWTATNVMLTNALPPGVKLLSATTSQGTFVATNDVIICNLGTLYNGANATVTLGLQTTVPGSIANTATISASGLSDPNPANNSAATNIAVGPVPTISIGDLRVPEGNSSRLLSSFPIRLSAASTEPISVRVTSTNGSALAGVDFDGFDTAIIFPPAGTNKSLLVRFLPLPIHGDTLVESDEAFFVLLSQPTNALLAVDRAAVSIVDDDLNLVSVANASTSEGDAGIKDLSFSVSLISGLTQPVSVDFTTANGTALAGRDYLAKEGTLVFQPGITNKVVNVPVIGNRVPQPDKTFFLAFNPLNAILAMSEAKGTILDDDSDGPPQIESVALDVNSMKVRFFSVQGHRYRLERSDTLSPGSWIPVGVEHPGTGGVLELEDQNVGTAFQRYYRVQWVP